MTGGSNSAPNQRNHLRDASKSILQYPVINGYFLRNGSLNLKQCRRNSLGLSCNFDVGKSHIYAVPTKSMRVTPNMQPTSPSINHTNASSAARMSCFTDSAIEIPRESANCCRPGRLNSAQAWAISAGTIIAEYRPRTVPGSPRRPEPAAGSPVECKSAPVRSIVGLQLFSHRR